MIDTRNETMLLLSDVPRWLARRGVTRSHSAVRNWVRAGWLEVVKWGGGIYTSEEALDRHAKRLCDGVVAAGVVDRAAAEEAGRELKARGWG